VTLRELDAEGDPLEFWFRRLELDAGIMHQSQGVRDMARAIVVSKKLAEAEATVDVTHETYLALSAQLDEVRELLRDQVRRAAVLSQLFEIAAARAGLSLDEEATPLPTSAEVA